MAHTTADVVERMKQAFSDKSGLPVFIPMTSDLKVRVDWFKETDFREIVDLVLRSRDEGKGVGASEFSSEEIIRQKIEDPQTKLSVSREVGTNHLVAVFFMFPCLLSRSQRSPNCGAFGFVHEKYRGKGVGASMILLQQFLACSLGQRTVLGRHALTSRTNIPGRSAGATYLGIIPKSLRMQNLTAVVDDVITYYGFHAPQLQPDPWMAVPCTPDLNADSNMIARFYKALPTAIKQRFLGKKIPGVKGELGLGEAEAEKAENFIRKSAREGHVMALDEFLDNGIWNRKLLKETHVVGIFDTKNDLVGLMLFGASGVCRTESLVMGGYLLLEKGHRVEPVQRRLMDIMTDIARTLSFEGVLLDVYRTETDFMSLLLDLGFKVSGTLPECGYVKDKGYVDSVLLYKEFVVGSSKL